MDLGTIIWLHDRIGNAAPLFMAVLGIWNLVNFFRKQGLDGSIIGAIVIGEIMMVSMGVLGIILFVALNKIHNLSIHFLYGVLSVVILPGVWEYTRGETEHRRSSLIWGLASLFLMGLIFRAIGTAG